MGALGILGALAGGYTAEAQRDREMKFRQDENSRQAQLALIGNIVSNPAVPPEYKGDLIQGGLTIAQGGKFSFDKYFKNLPAINTPSKTQSVAQPPTTLAPPPPPPTSAPYAQPIGTPAATPPTNGVAGLPAGVAPVGVPPMVLPGGNATATLAPQQVSPAGTFHIMSPQEMQERETAAKLATAQQIASGANVPLAQVLGIRPQFEKLAPGEELRDLGGGLVAKNQSLRQGLIQFEPKFGPGGEFVGVEDHLNNKLLTGDDLLRDPEARQVAQSALQAVADRETRVENREKRMAGYQADRQARAFTQQVKMFEDRERAKEEALSNTTKTMVEAAPKVLALSQRIRNLVSEQEQQLGPASGRWNEFMTGKIGAPNPEFTKLRTNVSLLQTLLMRMHTGARGGQYIMQHFNDLVNSGKQSPENMMSALDEIDQYAQDVAHTSRGVMDNRDSGVTPPSKPPGGAKPTNDPLGLFEK